MLKKLFILILISTLFYPLQPGRAVIYLAKTQDSSTLYYIDEQNIRHAFPNEITYLSWFGRNFSPVTIVSDDFIKTIPLGKNITLKAGKYLVKIPSRPEVYVVEPGGTLRHIINPTLAAALYGKNWPDKVVDLPEVFFENYVIGQPIEYAHQIPDGVVYKLENKDSYYYKTRGHVKKFSSWQNVVANGYNERDVIEGITTFLLHGKEITGYDAGINNLRIENNLAKYDCENKNLRATFIFVYNNVYTQQELDKINALKNQLPAYFSRATDNLSKISLDSEIFLIKKKDYHIFEGNLSLQQVSYDFYDQQPDNYDFLIIFDNFSKSNKKIAEHRMATNHITGIHKPILEAEVQFGSLGKLKGLVNMFNINDHLFDNERNQNYTLNNLMHEILHQWSGSLVFLNQDNEDDLSLLNNDRLHWSNYVNFTSPLGGLGWSENENGTFSYQPSTDFKIKLSDLDLYALGLLPVRAIDKIFYLMPAQGESGSIIKAQKNVVDKEQLVKAMGEWQCLID